MPKTHRDEEEEEEEVAEKRLADDDDSSDEESDDESDEESGSDSEDESGSGSDSDDDSGSDSDDESDSDSDTDDSSSKKKNKNKNKKGKEDEDDDDDGNTIFKIQEISSKLSWLLDDLHRTFKPKSVPKIDPQNVFPYPYSSLPQHSPSSIKNVSNDMKSPISSPIRHGRGGSLCDRGAGGNYIYPSYAAPPTKNDIKKLYQNYTYHERQRIAQNQQKEEKQQQQQQRRRSKRDSNFSDKFIFGSNERIQQKKRKLFAKQKQLEENEMPHSFDELYKHYDQQKRLIEHKQNKMKRLKNKMYWFRNNNHNIKNFKISEKKPLIKQINVNNKKNEEKNFKETETNLLNKAAQILLGNGNNDNYDVICPDSPDSLQQKILHITSDKDEEEEENRLPTFV